MLAKSKLSEVGTILMMMMMMLINDRVMCFHLQITQSVIAFILIASVSKVELR